MNINSTAARFVSEQNLPPSYLETISRYFAPLAEKLVQLSQSQSGRPLIVGVHGCQGSGKSTLTDFLIEYLPAEHGVSVVGMSIDDFYLSKAERASLAKTVHPLFATRGVPGTHDIAQLNSVLDGFIGQELPITIPRFDKSVDDLYPPEQFSVVSECPDIVILEGWCVGSPAGDAAKLNASMNELEKNEDADLFWRKYSHEQLQGDYAQAFNKLDHLIMLKAPGFHTVVDWRKEQEARLQQKLEQQGLDTSQLMTEAAIERFVQFYQRITTDSIELLPSLADDVFSLDEQRKIVAYHSNELSHLQEQS